MIDQFALIHSISQDYLLGAGIIGTLIAGKWVGAEACGRGFDYGTAATTAWTLPLLQVTAPLVIYKTFNAAGQPLRDVCLLTMVLVKAIIGPILTHRFAPRMVAAAMEYAGGSMSEI
jgi:hypothetical protein